MNYSAQMKSAIRTAPDPYSAILYMSMYGNGDQAMLTDQGLPRPTHKPVAAPSLYDADPNKPKAVNKLLTDRVKRGDPQ